MTERHRRWRLLVLLVGVACLVPGGQAGAAVTVGAEFPSMGAVNCVPNSTFMQGGTDGASPSWDAPSDGVITSWRTQAPDMPDLDARFRVMRPTGNPDVWTVVGNGPLENLTPNTLNVMLVRISVMAGDRIAVGTGTNGGPCTYESGLMADTERFRTGSPLAPGMAETLPVNGTGRRANVSALLEADGDADGFGDETQDMCVGTAGTESGCPAPAPPAGDSKTTPPPAKKKKCKKKKKAKPRGVLGTKCKKKKRK